MIEVKVKATGLVIDVVVITAVAGNNLYKDVNSDRTYLPEEIEPAEPDWQQVRIQASIAAMQAQLTSYQTMVSLAEKVKERGLIIEEALAKCSVDYANALIEELKKGGQDERD